MLLYGQHQSLSNDAVRGCRALLSVQVLPVPVDGTPSGISLLTAAVMLQVATRTLPAWKHCDK